MCLESECCMVTIAGLLKAEGDRSDQGSECYRNTVICRDHWMLLYSFVEVGYSWTVSAVSVLVFCNYNQPDEAWIWLQQRYPSFSAAHMWVPYKGSITLFPEVCFLTRPKVTSCVTQCNHHPPREEALRVLLVLFSVPAKRLRSTKFRKKTPRYTRSNIQHSVFIN